MKYLSKIKDYISRHQVLLYSITGVLGAIGLYLTNAPDLLLHISEHVATGYVIDGIAVIVSPKNPQPLREMAAYISGSDLLGSVTLLLNEVFPRKEKNEIEEEIARPDEIVKL